MFNNKEAMQTLETIVIVILIALFIRTFIVQAFDIPSGSMATHFTPWRLYFGQQIHLWNTNTFREHQDVFL